MYRARWRLKTERSFRCVSKFAFARSARSVHQLDRFLFYYYRIFFLFLSHRFEARRDSRSDERNKQQLVARRINVNSKESALLSICSGMLETITFIHRQECRNNIPYVLLYTSDNCQRFLNSSTKFQLHLLGILIKTCRFLSDT